jgi:hypothetical protein
VEALADQALIGCLKLLMALERDKRLRAMGADPRLQARALRSPLSVGLLYR